MHPIAEEFDSPIARLVELGHGRELGFLERSETAKRLAVLSYQHQHGLHVLPHPSGDGRVYSRLDGLLGSRTEHHMRTAVRKCGLPDKMPRGVAGRTVTGLCGWPDGYTVQCCNRLGDYGDLSAAEVSDAYLNAIKGWQAVCGILMGKTDSCDDANIFSDPGRMSAGTWAWSYMPPCNADADTTIQQEYRSGAEHTFATLQEVIQHEVGHAIGFDHLTYDSVMSASGPLGRYDVPQPDDIKTARKFYGPPKAPPVEPPPPPGDLELEYVRLGRFGDVGVRNLLAAFDNQQDDDGDYIATLHFVQ